MYEPTRFDYAAEKPCEMDQNVHNIHDGRAHRPGGDDADLELTAKLMRDIRNMSDRQQLLVGATVGFVGSYLLARTGKYMCIFAGASVIVLQLAGQNNYIKFNLLRSLSSEDVPRTASETRRRTLRPMLATFFRRLHAFMVEQPNLTSGIIGGFLIGLGFSA